MKLKKKYREPRKIKVSMISIRFQSKYAKTWLVIETHFHNPTAILISATEYHLGTLKAKLAKYRGQLLEPSGKKGEKGEGFDVLKSGDARAVMIGFPSVGKVGYLTILF